MGGMAGGAHEHRLRVRYAETDQMGIAHHAAYVIYLEEARTRMLADRGLPYGELEERGFGLVLRRVELRYLSPARFDEELVIRTQVERVGGASIALAYEIRSATSEAPLVTARTELVCVRIRDGGRAPAALPDDFRALLSALSERT
jgi:acyl-CoA thioester hydrolase